MRKINLWSSIVVGLVLPFSALAQNAAWKEASSGGYTYKYVQGDPTQSRFYTLKNGLTVILSPTDKEPRIQTYIAVKAGSKTDPATNTGLAHYLEHMLFKGTDKYGTLDWSKEKPILDAIDALYEQYNTSKDEATRKAIYQKIDSVSGVAAKFAIANEYDKMMAEMGAKGTNAWTSFEETVYTEDVPSNALNKYLAVQAERFRKPVLRIFHTELEAVYEEKNRGLDSDGRKQIEEMFATLFPNNNYGKQTTIGTIEHLKNPSLVEIRKYFDTYYVPNNMGIVMSGDFNPDEVIKQIDKDFSYMQNKPVPAYTFEPEKEIATPIVKEVFGPESENVMLGFRLPGASHKDAQILNLVGKILTNGSAGLIDLNLILEQKLLGAYAFPYVLQDYSMLLLQGMPVQGQSLDDVRSLMLSQIEILKSGNFSDELIQSIVNNEKKAVIESNENYSSRASELVGNFTSGVDWTQQVDYTYILSNITKADIMAFAKKYLNNNYVAVYKRQGEDKNITKVEKPVITPISINREAVSDFSKQVSAIPENVIAPKWLDYNKDIAKVKKGPYEFLAVENKDNSLFRLYYRVETGSWNSKVLSLAADYINYVGTKKMTASDFNQKMYNLAGSFGIQVGAEATTISIDGLYENFDKTVALVEDLLNNAVADETSLEAYKVRLAKSRENAKKNKGAIMRGLQNYAQYGEKNPFNNTLTNEELKNLKAQDLINAVKELLVSEQKVIYYGPNDINKVASQVVAIHKAPKGGLKPIKNTIKYTQTTQDKTSVLFADYDMVQAEVYWLRNADHYHADIVPTASLFNAYFGGGMGSIVFQTIRESKALAYSTFASFSMTNNRAYKNTVLAYVGTQSDKFTEATVAMNELLNVLPQSDKNVATAKEGLVKSLATQRITQESIIFSYLNAQKLGRDYDIRKVIFDKVPSLTFNDLNKFHNKEFSNKKYTYCVVASKDKINMDAVKALGETKILDLETIFGY